MPGAAGRWRWAVGLGLVLVGTTAAPRPAVAQAERPAVRREGDVLYYRYQKFRVPFTIDPADRARIKEVQLYYSADSGQSWKLAGQASPDQTTFTFRAARDAEYWFAVRTLDVRGRLDPPDDAVAEPKMKVIVDSTPPSLVLTPMSRRGSRAAVRWEIRDEHLDPRSLVIQYRAEGAPDWREVPIRDYALIGAQEWDAGTAGRLLVRAWVDDKAGNRAEADLALGDGIAAAPTLGPDDLRHFEPPPPISPIRSASVPDVVGNEDELFGPPPGGPRGGDPRAFPPERADPGGFAADPAPRRGVPSRSGGPTMLVGSPQFALQYAVEDAGPEGPALVELWVTRDGGRTWARQLEDLDRTSPYQVDLGSEGTYGLWLVVQSASGLGDPPPQPGDRPQLWVEVDTTPPAVRLDPPRVGHGPALGKVLITWQASDAHLAEKPVLLSYRADRPDASWIPIGGRMDNTGRYIWTVGPEVPVRFHLRIDVVDSVGNRSSAETTQSSPLIVDRSRPRGRILGLEGTGSTPDRSRR